MEVVAELQNLWSPQGAKLASTAAALVLEELTVMALPVTCAALFGSRGSRWSRGGVLVSVAACAGLSRLLSFQQPMPLTEVFLVHAYYVVTALATFWLMPWVAAGWVGKPTALVASFVAYVLLPGLVLDPALVHYVLVFGWHAMLAAYAYCVDAQRFSERTSAMQCLFFVLVDPSLVFPLRAKPGPVPAGQASRRLVRGVTTAAAAGTALQLLPYTAEVGGGRLAGAAASALALAASIYALYVLRAGFAEVRVGLLGLLGYRTAAGFDRPYLAHSPVDFWRRWNVWVGNWARRYVFWPTGSWLARRTPARLVHGAQATALIATFLVVGVLHDVLVMVGERRLYGASAAAFLCAGALAVGWEIAGGKLAPTLPRSTASLVRRAGMALYLLIFLRMSGYV